MKQFHCDTHGWQKATFICQHLAMSIVDGVARGLWSTDDEEGYINAYCDDCEECFKAVDMGKATQQDAETFMGVKLSCVVCYDKLLVMNGYGVN